MNHIFKAIALKIEQLDVHELLVPGYLVILSVIFAVVAIFSK